MADDNQKKNPFLTFGCIALAILVILVTVVFAAGCTSFVGGLSSGNTPGNFAGSGGGSGAGSGTGGIIDSDCLTDSNVKKYIGLVNKYAALNGLDPALIAAQIEQESGWNPNAISKSGAQGLMQLMPGTAAGLGVTNALDPEQNIRGGTKYLAQQYKTFGRTDYALAAYNAGPGSVQQYGGIPPIPETRDYVDKILNIRYPKYKKCLESQTK